MASPRFAEERGESRRRRQRRGECVGGVGLGWGGFKGGQNALEGCPSHISESSCLTVAALEAVQRGEDLAVVGDEGLANEWGAVHQQLQNAQGPCHHCWVLGVEGLCEFGVGPRMQVRDWKQAGWCDSDSKLYINCGERKHSRDARLMGMISCGTTGKILLPPCASRSLTPCSAKKS